MKNPRVLVIFADGFEEIEAVVPVDILRRAGAEVTLARVGNTDETGVRGRCGIVVAVGEKLADVAHLPFEMLVLPGGPVVGNLRKNPRVLKLVRDFFDAGKWIGAICAAPLILNDAGVLAGKNHTVFSACANELPDAKIHERVVRDGKIITSRGAGTAQDFALELTRCLFSDTVASAVAGEILA